MDSELLAKFDEMVARFKKEFNDIIEKEREKMKAEVEAYNAEKERMETVSVRDDDIIHLNVSGLKLTTNRSTLCQVEGSLLASMFSGRWEDRVKRDQDGAVFFDVNPQHFTVILDYLRIKKIASPENPAPLPKVPEDQLKEFNILVEYLSLKDELVHTETVRSEKFNLHSEGVTTQEGGQVAVHDSSVGHKYILGENIYNQEIAHIKLKLESFNNSFDMFVGIAKGDINVAVQKNDSSGEWPGSYGWQIGTREGVRKDRSFTDDNSLKNLIKTGDTIELVLNCDAGKLSLNLATCQQFHIDIPKSKTWRLNVYFYGPNDKIRIVNK